MFIGVDFGTQGVRCGVITKNGDFLASRECGYNTYYPQEGWAEQKPLEWKEAFLQAMRDCLSALTGEQRQNIQGMCVDTTASTVLPVARDGKELSDAILWMDIRAKEEARLITDTRSGSLKFCGAEVSPEWHISKTLWLKRNRRELYDKAYKVVEFQDYINYYLTGNWAASICHATCKSTYVEDYGKWDKDLMTRIGLEDFENKFNLNILRLGDEVGVLREELAEELSLPNIPVYQGGIDAYVGLFGMGVCRPGDICIAMGTSFVQLVLTDQLTFSDGLWGPYNNAVIPGLFCLEGGQISAGSITKWFIKEFHVEGENKYMAIANEAAQIPPGSDGVVVLDCFQGNRTPYKDPYAKGVFYGLMLAHTRAHMYRAVLESIAFGNRNIVDCMVDAGVPVNRIFACGGVTRNDIWMQIMADVLGRDFVLVENSSQASVLGGAIIAAYGSGVYKSIEEAVNHMVRVAGVVKSRAAEKQKYEEAFSNYKAIYKALREVTFQ